MSDEDKIRRANVSMEAKVEVSVSVRPVKGPYYSRPLLSSSSQGERQEKLVLGGISDTRRRWW